MAKEPPTIDPGGQQPGQWPAGRRMTASSTPAPAPATGRPVSEASIAPSSRTIGGEPISAAPLARPQPLPRPRPSAQPSRSPAARMLHAAPRTPGTQSSGTVVAAHQPFRSNPALQLAQLAILAQSALGATTAVNLMRGTKTLGQLASGVTMSSSSSLADNYGKGVAVMAAVLILGVITVSLPSQIARALLALLEFLMLCVTLAAHFGGGSVLGFVTVLTAGASGSALIPFSGVIALQSATIYLLAIHPPTYRAFARSQGAS